MKIRIVSEKAVILTLNPAEKAVHMAFRPSNKDIFQLVETCPKLEIVQLPHSYMKNVSKSVEMFLRLQRIKLVEGDLWGARTDRDCYREIAS